MGSRLRLTTWSTRELNDFRQAAAWPFLHPLCLSLVSFSKKSCVRETRIEGPPDSQLLTCQYNPKTLLLFANASSNNGSQAHLLHFLDGQQHLRPEQRISNVTLNSSCATSKGAESKSHPCFRRTEPCSRFGTAEFPQSLEEIPAQFTTYFSPTESSYRTVVWVYTPVRSYDSASHRRRRCPTQSSSPTQATANSGAIAWRLPRRQQTSQQRRRNGQQTS